MNFCNVREITENIKIFKWKQKFVTYHLTKLEPRMHLRKKIWLSQIFKDLLFRINKLPEGSCYSTGERISCTFCVFKSQLSIVESLAPFLFHKCENSQRAAGPPVEFSMDTSSFIDSRVKCEYFTNSILKESMIFFIISKHLGIMLNKHKECNDSS